MLEFNPSVDAATRDDCAIARGLLSLALEHDENVDLKAAEKRLARAAERVGTPDWRTEFLVRLRGVTGWLHL